MSRYKAQKVEFLVLKNSHRGEKKDSFHDWKKYKFF